MQAEPLLLEKIDDYILILPDGNRISFKDALEKKYDLEYVRYKFYVCKPDSFQYYINFSNLEFFQKPFMIFSNTLECPQMSKIKYDQYIINRLNCEGLHIFLLENILKYDGDRIKLDVRNFHKDIHLLENNTGMKYGKFKNPKAFQLESVTDLIKNNNLTNVTVYVQEYGLDKFFEKTYPQINFVWKDIDMLRHFNFVKNTDSVIKKDFKYSFLCYNWRYEPYRHAIASYVSNYNSKISWYYKTTEEIFRKSLWFNPDIVKNDMLISGFKKLNDDVPLIIDHNINTPVILEGNVSDRLKIPSSDFAPYELQKKMFEDIFCTIVAESGYIDPTCYISEKTLSSIWHKTPFVLAAPPYTLKLLKKLGFKTFSDYWDESYDDEEDHTNRLLKVFSVIDYISTMPLSKAEKIYQEMRFILDHNKENYIKLEKELKRHDFKLY